MTRRRTTIQPVPFGPAHRRDWRTLWRRCSCGLTVPCLDRRLTDLSRAYPTIDGPHRPGTRDPGGAGPPGTAGRPGMAYRQLPYSRW